MSDIRKVPLQINMDTLRAELGLTKAELPDDASAERIEEVLAVYRTGVRHGLKAGRGSATPALMTPGVVADALDSDDYDASWLSPTERARINAAREGGEPPT